MAQLSGEAVARFRTQGYHAPIAALGGDEIAGYRAALERHEAAHGRLSGPWRQKTHLLFTWADALIRHPGVLDAVESMIGPDILCWSSSFFIKEPDDPGFVSWHQDSTYWGLEPPDIVTAWLAFTESSTANGALLVVPGTHLQEQMPHRDTFAAHNMLSRGQEIAVEVDEAQAVVLPLAPGEMSLHHVRLVHGSDPNPSDRRRVGFAIRYLPTHVRQTAGARDHATLVRGVDRFGHFQPERRPGSDLEAGAVEFHRAVTANKDAINLRGAADKPGA
jgi:non-haem Fe2+, alpha-ketoglutarate-dependent halogenase